VDAWLTSVLGALDGLGPLRLLIPFVGMFCETSILIGLIVPGDTVVLLSSAATVRAPLDFVLQCLAVVLGSIAGESVGFALGHFLGPRLRYSRLGRWIGERNWIRAEAYLERRGGIAVFVSRFLPVLHALVPITVGTSSMIYRRFLAWTVPACVVWTLVYVSLGTVAGASYRALGATLNFAGWIFFGIVAAGVVVAWLVHRLAHRHERAAEDAERDAD
jgi:membrane protein DedA with SNARE-associated domain